MTKLDDKELSPTQIQAVSLLAIGESITTVAEKLKVSRQTVSTWLNQDANFQLQLRIKQGEVWEKDIKRIRSLTSKAIDVLSEALENDDIKVRLNAARLIVSMIDVSKALDSQTRPLHQEFWRPLTEKEKENRRFLSKYTGESGDNLDNVLVKLS